MSLNYRDENIRVKSKILFFFIKTFIENQLSII